MALKKIIENHGNVSKSMREVGYSVETAKNPSQLTESKGFKQLMEEYLPDSLLMEKHKDLLTVPRKVRISIKDEMVTETEELDSNAVKAGLDMAYKIKGAYKEDNAQKQPLVIINKEKAAEITKALEDL